MPRSYGLLERAITAPVILYCERKGMSIHYARRVAHDWYDDAFRESRTSWRQKLWAWKRGFLSERIARYGLTDHNHKDYMSEWEYALKRSFKNAGYNWWIEDKLLFRYVMEPFKEYLPNYYYAVNKGQLRKLQDLPSGKGGTSEDLLLLLSEKGALAAKLIKGAAGWGFYKMGYDNGEFSLNGKACSEQDMLGFLKGLENYLITEYVYAHRSLRKIYSKTPNAVRLITIHDHDEGTQVTGSFIRFGSDRSGYVDNAVAGGLFCGVDLRDGRIYGPKRYEGKDIVASPRHPSTGVVIEGNVPNWDLIKSVSRRIGEHLSNLPYLTYDLVATDDGFKILEINSHGLLSHLQPFYPFFKDPYQRKLFGR